MQLWVGHSSGDINHPRDHRGQASMTGWAFAAASSRLSWTSQGFFSWCAFSPNCVLKAGSELPLHIQPLYFVSSANSILWCDRYPVSFLLVHHHGSKMLRSESNSSITATQPTLGRHPPPLASPAPFSLSTLTFPLSWFVLILIRFIHAYGLTHMQPAGGF